MVKSEPIEAFSDEFLVDGICQDVKPVVKTECQQFGSDQSLLYWNSQRDVKPTVKQELVQSDQIMLDWSVQRDVKPTDTKLERHTQGFAGDRSMLECSVEKDNIKPSVDVIKCQEYFTQQLKHDQLTADCAEKDNIGKLESQAQDCHQSAIFDRSAQTDLKKAVIRLRKLSPKHIRTILSDLRAHKDNDIKPAFVKLERPSFELLRSLIQDERVRKLSHKRAIGRDAAAVQEANEKCEKVISPTSKSKLKEQQVLQTIGVETDDVGSLCKFACKSCPSSYVGMDGLNAHFRESGHGKRNHALTGPQDEATNEVVMVHRCRFCSKLLLCQMKSMRKHFARHKLTVKEYCYRFGCREVATDRTKTWQKRKQPRLGQQVMDRVCQNADKSDEVGNLCRYRCDKCGRESSSWYKHSDHFKRAGHGKCSLLDLEKYLKTPFAHKCLECNTFILCDQKFVCDHMMHIHGISFGEYRTRHGLVASGQVTNQEREMVSQSYNRSHFLGKDDVEDQEARFLSRAKRRKTSSLAAKDQTITPEMLSSESGL